jgi:hypothetical protein
MRFLEELLHSQTPFCHHSRGCLMTALKQALKNLKYGLVISLLLQLVRTLKMMLKHRSTFSSTLKRQYFTLALFLPATALILKLVRCALRRVREKDDGLNSFLAGAAAGWVAYQTLSADYCYFYLTFIGSRLLGAVHGLLIERGTLKKENTHLHAWAMMAFAHSVHSVGYFLYPYILKEDVYGLYEKMSALTPKEKRWHHAGLTNRYRVMQ